MSIVLLLVAMGGAASLQSTAENGTSERTWVDELTLPDGLETRRRVLETPHDFFRFVSIPFSTIFAATEPAFPRCPW